MTHESEAFRNYKEHTREVLAQSAGVNSRPSFTTHRTVSDNARQESLDRDRAEPIHELPPRPAKNAPIKSPPMMQGARPMSTKNQNNSNMFKICFDGGRETYIMPAAGSMTQRGEIP